MARSVDPLEILARHQFPEEGGGCTSRDCVWGLAVCDKSCGAQMAEHQLEMLEQSGFKVVRA